MRSEIGAPLPMCHLGAGGAGPHDEGLWITDGAYWELLRENGALRVCTTRSQQGPRVRNFYVVSYELVSAISIYG